MWAKRIKDKKFRRNFKKSEVFSFALNYLMLAGSVDNFLKFHLLKKNVRGGNYSWRSKIKNRCVLTSRARSIVRLVRLSRVVFRSLASSGNLVGLKKSS